MSPETARNALAFMQRAELKGSGTYTSGNAIRVPADQAVAFENTGQIKMAFLGGGSKLQVLLGAMPKVGFVISATPGIEIAGTPVIGQRNTGWATATGTVGLCRRLARVSALVAPKENGRWRGTFTDGTRPATDVAC